MKLLEVLERSLGQGQAWQFKVSVPDAIDVIKKALAHDPIPSLGRNCDAYPTTEDPSKGSQHVEACAAKGVLTRTSRMEKASKSKAFRRSLVTNMGVSDSIADQELFSLVLRHQFDTTMSPLWSKCTAYDPSNTKISSPQVVKQTHAHVDLPIRVEEDYAGQASLSKSTRDSGGSEFV